MLPKLRTALLLCPGTLRARTYRGLNPMLSLIWNRILSDDFAGVFVVSSQGPDSKSSCELFEYDMAQRGSFRKTGQED